MTTGPPCVLRDRFIFLIKDGIIKELSMLLECRLASSWMGLVPPLAGWTEVLSGTDSQPLPGIRITHKAAIRDAAEEKVERRPHCQREVQQLQFDVTSDYCTFHQGVQSVILVVVEMHDLREIVDILRLC